jgi:EAL domain-containing protein (putative c-di-GMP-specific phosphodiesterase class I)/DNA-binding NarL/FixJ family response regulator
MTAERTGEHAGERTIRVRVLLAEDDPVVRSALVDLLATDPGLELVGLAADADEAIAAAERLRPDVAVLDVRMPGGGGPRAAREIARRSRATRIIGLSAHGDRSSVNDMLRAGAIGYVLKGSSINEVLNAIHRAASGEDVLSGEVAVDVVRTLAGQLQREAADAARRGIVEDRVRAALVEGALDMAFQPIVRLADGAVMGYEALARFNIEPQRTPDAWFREAAEVGLGPELELTAIRAALDRLDEIPGPAYLSLNLSPECVVTQQVADSIEGWPAKRIVVELTEHARVSDYEALAHGLAGVRDRGARLAVDDAGAGFASLRHILQLSPDIIKLDVSITHDIDKHRAGRALAAGLISFADEMGLAIVAEGIETKDELETLRDLGVGMGQGFFIGRPAAAPNPPRWPIQ